MNQKDKIEKLKPFDDERYANVDLDHLAVYAMGELEKIGVDLSFENGVVAVFKLFPKKFSLPGFPLYPDSKRANDCFWRCADKRKKWLGGKSRHGFIITERSRRFIKEAEELLTIPITQKTKASSQTRRKELIISEVDISPVFSKYKEGKGESIKESELCHLLQGTLDSSKEILLQNLLSLKTFAEELDRKDILEFLVWLEQKFKEYLKSV